MSTRSFYSRHADSFDFRRLLVDRYIFLFNFLSANIGAYDAHNARPLFRRGINAKNVSVSYTTYLPARVRVPVGHVKSYLCAYRSIYDLFDAVHNIVIYGRAHVYNILRALNLF